VPILIKPTALSTENTLKASLRFLQAKGIAVGGSWSVDADIVLVVYDQDVQKAMAALAEAGFVAIVQKGK
jgi:roadblock/LC7 domain-containing protein